MPPRTTKKASAKSGGTRTVRSLRITMPTASSSTAPAAPAEKPVTEDDVNQLSIASLTLDTPLRTLARPRRVPATPFHFLSLAAEIRIKIYEYYFNDVETLLELSPLNYKRYHKMLGVMRVCRQVHDEATFYFYSTRTFRMFSTSPGRHFKTKKPMLARMRQSQRRCLTSLELYLGPGWDAPPVGWSVTPAQGLRECESVHTVKVYVEFDPSVDYIKDYRRSGIVYPEFSGQLLADMLDELPSVHTVEFDGWVSVKKSGPMIQALLAVAREHNCNIEWGPTRGWTDDPAEEEDDQTATTIHPQQGMGPAPGPGPHGIITTA